MAVLALGIASTSVMAVRESRARHRADLSAQRATASALQAETLRTAALGEAYQARLAAALAAMSARDIREAGRQLEAAPPQKRGWEWRHLRGRLDQCLAVVAGLPERGVVAFCPPGQRIAVANGHGYRILDAVTGKPIFVRPAVGPCRGVYAFGTRAGLRYVLDESESTQSFAVTDQAGCVLSRITLPAAYRSRPAPVVFVMAMSPDGRRLALQSVPYTRSPLIEIFDTATGLLTATCGGQSANLLGLAFSPDGTQIAAVQESHQVFVYDSAAGKLATVLTGHQGVVRGVAFSPDGLRLATCADDQTIRVWEVGTRRVLRTHARSCRRRHVRRVQPRWPPARFRGQRQHPPALERRRGRGALGPERT